MPVDMKASFGADIIDMDGINKITLTAQGHFWTLLPLKNDQWKVKGKRREIGFSFQTNLVFLMQASRYEHSALVRASTLRMMNSPSSMRGSGILVVGAGNRF